MKPGFTPCLLMLMMLFGLTILVVSASKDSLASRKMFQKDLEETSVTEREALDKDKKLERELKCPCGVCKDPLVPEAPLGCCRCGCQFGGGCYSPNIHRYRCCDDCPCNCYDTAQKKTRCCPCGCKCGYSFSKNFLWFKGTPKCKKCKGIDLPIIGSVKKCFQATALVKLEKGKSIAMSDLQVGDRVQTVSEGRLKYSKVRAFLQKEHDVVGMYLSITTLSNISITLSENHLIYTRKSGSDKFNTVYANKISIGDEVMTAENNELKTMKVKEISKFATQGAYVPLTGEGNIMVDGVLASCYASFDQDLAHFTISPMQWFPVMMEWIFGGSNATQVYVSIVKTAGRYLLPVNYINVKPVFERK